MNKSQCQYSYCFIVAALLTVGIPATQATQIWFDGFEVPVVSGKFSGTDPGGWTAGGSSQGLSNTDCLEFTTTNGSQAAWVYGSNSMTTKSTNLVAVLEANKTYTLTFDVCKLSSLSDADYVVHLKAGSTILATTTGTVSTTDMSENGSLQFITGSSHPNMGENLYVTLTAANNRHPHYDSIALDVSDAPEDTTKPSPDPMTWAIEPYAVDYDSITMTATTATDETTVEYLFTNTVKGTSSGWHFSREWCETNLAPSTLYSYKGKARDTSANLNETAWSTPIVSAVTLAAEPTLIFKENFESPDITGFDSGATPPGWTETGHGGYQGLLDEDAATMVTIYGSQVASLYSDSCFITQSTYLTNTLAGKTTYSVTFHVGDGDTSNDTGYRVELLADTNILGVATGTVSTTDMSLTTDEIVYETTADNPYIDEILAIKLTGNASRTRFFDNVRLYATPFPPSGTLLILR